MEKEKKTAGSKKKWIILITVLVLFLAAAVTAAVILHRPGGENLQNPVTESAAPTQYPTESTAVQTTASETQAATVPTETEAATEPPQTEETTVPTQPETTAPPETKPTEPETKPTEPEDENAIPAGYGEYMNVGSTYIAEVVAVSAETFNGKTKDDYSAPIRNFLPEGTLDYASTKTVKNSEAEYVLLRCGRRVYTEKKNTPGSSMTQVVECYYGTLPDHNEVGFVSLEQEGRFTVLTVDVLWKAPFYLKIGPQKYRNPSARDYRITKFTAEYVDITFCYATEFEGDITVGDNPLFKSAKLTRDEYDCTLRLYLKKAGSFCGYDTYYNENDQLCFKFLNPASGTQTDQNSYGADLTGIRIMIDVGHGGRDCGCLATGDDGKQVEEEDLNLALAEVLKAELETMGATVILNRTDDSTLRVDDRVQSLRDAWPDICIAIHQNGFPDNSTVHGLQVCYSTPMSHDLAMLMYEHTVDAGIYRDAKYSWHYYYVAKQTICPVVLMECGYMTNPEDLAGMLDDAVLLQKARAMSKAAAQYFLTH